MELPLKVFEMLYKKYSVYCTVYPQLESARQAAGLQEGRQRRSRLQYCRYCTLLYMIDMYTVHVCSITHTNTVGDYIVLLYSVHYSKVVQKCSILLRTVCTVQYTVLQAN